MQYSITQYSNFVIWQKICKNIKGSFYSESAIRFFKFKFKFKKKKDIPNYYPELKI